MTRLRADALLLICAVLWGTTFVAQRGAADISPVLFVAARFALSTIVLAPLALLEHRRQRKARGLTVNAISFAILIGVCLCVGALMQQSALTTTTATNGGFLTAIYVVFVPLVNWLIVRKRPQSSVVLACILSLSGAWLLAGGGILAHWQQGDVILLTSDIVWAFHICLVSLFMNSVERPYFLCFIQSAVTALVAGIVGLAIEPPAARDLSAVLTSVLYAGIASGGIGFTLQVIAQRHTPPAEASLIMSLESVFAALAGAALLRERLSTIATFGCALILLAVLIVEVLPALRQRAG